jgi:HK97 family phage major capsid protein
MKKFLSRYRHLTALLAVLVMCFAMFMLGAPACVCFAIVACWQLAQLARSKPRRGYVYETIGLTAEQIKEFETLLKDLGGIKEFIPGLRELAAVEGGFAAIKKLPELLGAERKRVDEAEKTIGKLRKQIAHSSQTGVRWVGNVPFVTDDCAKALTSVLVLEAAQLGENAMRQVSREQRTWEPLVNMAAEIMGKDAKYFLKALGIEQRAGGALTPTDIPLPVIYMPQIVELVWKYGQARQFATVWPLGAGTVKLPRLQAGEDAFSFLGAGTAGMSQQIGEKEVTAALVTFTANKCGGLIRIPTELEEDTFIALGQFLARYISRQMAKLEDTTMFLGDGSATYANITGIGNYCVANPTYLHQLKAGNTVPTDATINDFRAMRALVNPAVLVDDPAYYMNPTMEALLVTFNTLNQPLIYIPARGGQPATLDGFPIRWIGVGQPYTLNAAPNTFPAFFGSLKYWYLGERGQVRVEVSREVFFATDELAMRALERIDVEAMAIDAMSAMQLPAA